MSKDFRPTGALVSFVNLNGDIFPGRESNFVTLETTWKAEFKSGRWWEPKDEFDDWIFPPKEEGIP